MAYCTAKRMFSYVEVPKAMFTEPALKVISADAKLLYGLMLDRMHLSEKNGWLDANGRVYIYYTLDDAMEVLGCSKGKALKVFDELDEGVRLIRREKQGTGKPTVIYVRVIEDDATTRVQGVNVKVGDSLVDEEDGKAQKMNAAGSDFEHRQVHGMYPNKTEINKPEESNLIRSMEEMDADAKQEAVRSTSISEIDSYRNRIRMQISYDALVARFPLEREMLDGIVDLMLDVQLSRRESVVVAKDARPTVLVQEKFRRIGSDHVVYVLDCMLRNTTKIRNIKSYLLAALYNAPSTISSFYRTEANHDFAKVAG